MNKLIFPLNFLKRLQKHPPLTFSMEHLLHRLYGVDAPASRVSDLLGKRKAVSFNLVETKR